jgi:hypothetical protein
MNACSQRVPINSAEEPEILSVAHARFPWLGGRRANVRDWRRFGREVRVRGCDLLRELPAFPNAVLISGCQRSGGTILARIISSSEGMVRFAAGEDEELAAAEILAGVRPTTAPGRYCFQTTYLNECYGEYLRHAGGYRLIWLVRNPYSVVYSMLYNWSRFALDELFAACGAPLLDTTHRARYWRFGGIAVSRLDKACLSYVGKQHQMLELAPRLGDALRVVDYDALVGAPDRALTEIYDFIGLSYRTSYADALSRRSLAKAAALSPAVRARIEQLCMPAYNEAKALTRQAGAEPTGQRRAAR